MGIPGDSDPVADPNPRRLEMVLDAARRGAHVQLQLDDLFDDGEALRSNDAAVHYMRSIAATEGLDLDARLGNPTGGGIHAGARAGAGGRETWSAVGSLNGGEVSHKLNQKCCSWWTRPAIYNRLAEVFAWDWARQCSSVQR